MVEFGRESPRLPDRGPESELAQQAESSHESEARYDPSKDSSELNAPKAPPFVPPKGWSEQRYGNLSGAAKVEYDSANAGAKLRSLWHGAGSIFSFKGSPSAEILKNGDGDKGFDAWEAPSKTVKKLTDVSGPRAARLAPSDLAHLATAISAGKDVKVVDGYSMSSGGMAFTQVNDRKPSDVLQKELADPENKGKKLLMPFTFPARGSSEEHIALVSADPKTKQIHYFDPKGAFSDDPSRIGGFEDDPNFNMRDNLEALQQKLGPGWRVLENTQSFQRDPTNCGSYIARAIEDEANNVLAGTGWQNGPAWINAEKSRMAIDLWNHFSGRGRPEIAEFNMDENSDG